MAVRWLAVWTSHGCSVELAIWTSYGCPVELAVWTSHGCPVKSAIWTSHGCPVELAIWTSYWCPVELASWTSHGCPVEWDAVAAALTSQNSQRKLFFRRWTSSHPLSSCTCVPFTGEKRLSQLRRMSFLQAVYNINRAHTKDLEQRRTAHLEKIEAWSCHTAFEITPLAPSKIPHSV